MFEYAVVQIVFALFLLSIPLGFATAIGWCDPTEHRSRPVLLGFSIFFSVFGVFGLIKFIKICLENLTPGQNFLDSATGLFNAIWEITVDSEMVRAAEEQIHALVFSGVAIVFIAAAFILSIFFAYVLMFRIALVVDKKLKNGIRYGVLGACLIIAVLIGVITSQYAIMGIAIAYVVISAAFLVFGNWRLMRSGDETVDEAVEVANTTRKGKAKQPKTTEAEDMAAEAKEFFGNSDGYKF